MPQNVQVSWLGTGLGTTAVEVGTGGAGFVGFVGLVGSTGAGVATGEVLEVIGVLPALHAARITMTNKVSNIFWFNIGTPSSFLSFKP